MDSITPDFAPVTRSCAGKINLSLAIKGRRADGYHLIDSLFWPLPSPCDTLRLRPGAVPGFELCCDTALPDLRNNTLTTSWEVFSAATGLAFALECDLEKHIPAGAGLGGGSADAACLLSFLRDLARNHGRDVTDAELAAMASQVGADVPFFLAGGPARVTGAGEIVEPLDATAVSLPGREVVLVMPGVHVSTSWAYAAYDEAMACKGIVTGTAAHIAKTLTEKRKASKQSFPKSSTAGLFVNDLEQVVFRKHPELALIKERLLQLGACAASMSGSGSTVFGVFTQHAAAVATASSMAWPVQLCHL